MIEICNETVRSENKFPSFSARETISSISFSFPDTRSDVTLEALRAWIRRLSMPRRVPAAIDANDFIF